MKVGSSGQEEAAGEDEDGCQDVSQEREGLPSCDSDQYQRNVALSFLISVGSAVPRKIDDLG